MDGTLFWQEQLTTAIDLWQSGQSSDACDLLTETEKSTELGAKARAQLKMERAYFLGLRAHFEDANTLFNEAEILLQQSNSLEAIGDLEWRRGLVLHFFGDFKASVRCLRVALASGEKEKNIGVVALGSAGIAKNLMMSGHSGEAIPWFERALAIFEKEGWRLHMSAIYSELGACYFHLENLDKSLQLLLQAEQIDVETGSRTGLQIVLANIGNVYLHRGEYFKAISYYQRAVDIARETDDRISVCKWLKNLSVAYSALGNEAVSTQFAAQAAIVEREIAGERARASAAGWATPAAQRDP